MEYQDGKIYKITGGGLTYYGSTKNKLNKRFNIHKNDLNCASKQIIELGGAIIELVELFPCETLNELLWRERWYIENNECVNIYLPIVTEEERKKKNNNRSNQRHYKNKKECNKNSLQYYYNHKEERKEQIAYKHSIMFTCECGSISTIGHKARHIKSKKHIQYLELKKI